METKEYTRIGEKLWHTRLDNGLHIYNRRLFPCGIYKQLFQLVGFRLIAPR